MTVVGVSMDEEDAPASNRSSKSIRWSTPSRSAPGSSNEQFQLTNYPVTVIYDRAGKLAKRFEGFTPERSLEEAVKSAL